MKTLIALLLLVNALLLGGRLWRETSAETRGGGAGAEATENGDTNGDGFRDVSDVVYMLLWLFKGGPDPVAVAQQGGGLTAEQEQILGTMSLVDLPVDDQGNVVKTLRVSGVNLQVVNGQGSTETKNGAGNLIVGYQEPRAAGNNRSGSHNVVAGKGGNYSSFGGLLAGMNNTVSGAYASVTGGSQSSATGRYAAVSGGYLNFAGGEHSSVSGGCEHTAGGIYASVTGGQANRADGTWSSVAGGQGRSATSSHDWRAGELFQEQ